MVVTYYCSDFEAIVKNFINRTISSTLQFKINELPDSDDDICSTYSPADILDIVISSGNLDNADIKSITNAVYSSPNFNIETLNTFYYCNNKLLNLIGKIGIILYDDHIYNKYINDNTDDDFNHLSKLLSDKYCPESIVNALIQINDYIEVRGLNESILKYNCNELSDKIHELIFYKSYDIGVYKDQFTDYQLDLYQLIRKLSNYIYSKYIENKVSENSDTVNTWWIYRDGVYLELLTWNSSTREYKPGYARTKKVIRIENIIIEYDSPVYKSIKDVIIIGDIDFFNIPVRAWNSENSIPLSEVLSIYSDYEDKFFDCANVEDNLAYNTLVMTKDKEDAKKVYEELMKIEVKPM